MLQYNDLPLIIRFRKILHAYPACIGTYNKLHIDYYFSYILIYKICIARQCFFSSLVFYIISNLKNNNLLYCLITNYYSQYLVIGY